MKRIMRRSNLVFFITIVFLLGLGFLTFKLISENNFWLHQAYNGHIQTSMGKIVDRNKVLLAYTDGDDRKYNDNASTRCALMHVVGDGTTNISTSLESLYSGKLTGYNVIFGMGLPKSLRLNTDIDLTVDANATTAAYEALGSNRGACVVYNYKTGEVLVDTSSYSYDPYDPPTINKDNEEEYKGVYLDNVASSTYTPGSIFKIVTSACAIENISDIYDQTFECNGEYMIDGEAITCEHVHGTLSFQEAFQNSCNCAYAQIALQLGEDKLSKTAEELGFNKEFSMSNIKLAKSQYDVKTAKSDYDLAWSGIGQYTDLANPMHMAILTGAIANGGTPVNPYIVANTTNILAQMGLTLGGVIGEEMMSSSVASEVKDLMRGAAESYSYGSGVSLGGLEFCAKTGTAEVGKDKEPNAWFVGFTDDSTHPYAFAVVVEEGGYGIGAAASVAQAAIDSLVG